MEKKDNNHIEMVQNKLDIIDEDKEKGMLKKGIVKEIMEIMERQANKLTNSKETLRKKLDIEKEKDMIRKEEENDGIKLEPNLLSNFIHNNMVQ